MRLLFGIILGAAITIGSAYVHDTFYAADPSNPTASRQIVNWRVAGEVAHNATRSAREQVEKLAGK